MKWDSIAALDCSGDDYFPDYLHYVHYDHYTVTSDPRAGGQDVPGLVTKGGGGRRQLGPEYSNAGDWIFRVDDESYLG